MIGIESYKKYRYSTRKTGWTLAAFIVQSSRTGFYRDVRVSELYEPEGRQWMEAAYRTEPEEIRHELARNILVRNLATTHGDRYSETVRFFEQDIEEVCRKMLIEISTIETIKRLGVTAEDVGERPDIWDLWLKGRRLLPDVRLDSLAIAADFPGKQKFLEVYERCMNLFGTHEQLVSLPDKTGCKKRIGY